MAPDTSSVKTVILWPADLVFKSWISEGTSHPMGPQAKPKEMEYSPICIHDWGVSINVAALGTVDFKVLMRTTKGLALQQ